MCAVSEDDDPNARKEKKKKKKFSPSINYYHLIELSVVVL